MGVLFYTIIYVVLWGLLQKKMDNVNLAMLTRSGSVGFVFCDEMLNGSEGGGSRRLDHNSASGKVCFLIKYLC